MRCPDCRRSFESALGLSTHRARAHGGVPEKDKRALARAREERYRRRKGKKPRTRFTSEAERREARNAWKRANRPAKATKAPRDELPQLYEELRHGKVVSFWEDELRMDLAQEKALAVVEGKDPEQAARAYRSREYAELKFAGMPLFLEILAENRQESFERY